MQQALINMFLILLNLANFLSYLIQNTTVGDFGLLNNYHAMTLDAMTSVKLIAVKHFSDGFDPSVYCKNKNFKCINQSKIAKPVQGWIEGSKSDLDHLVLHGIDFNSSQDIEGMTFDGIEIPHEPESTDMIPVETKIDILSIPQQSLPVPVNFDIMTAMPLDILAKLPNPPKNAPGGLNHNLIWQVMCWAKQSGIAFTQFWQWNLQKNNSVERFKRYQKQWDKCDYKTSSRTINAMLLRTYPKINETQVTKVFREQFDIPDVKIVDSEFLHADHIAHWRTKKFTVLVSPMGRNKTGATIDWISPFVKTQNMSVLWISPRITLSQNTLQRLNDTLQSLNDKGLEFHNYKDISKKAKLAGEMSKHDHLICSIQSLHYLDRNYDIIVADEWDTIASTFARDCKTHKHLAANWAIWMSQLNKAKKVIIMDAFSTMLTHNLLEHFRQKSLHSVMDTVTKTTMLGSMPLTFTRTKRVEQNMYEFVNLPHKPSPRKFVEAGDFKQWLWEILSALDDGKKIYVFTPFRGGKKGVEHITQVISDHMHFNRSQIVSYYAEKDEEKKRLSEVETVWSKPELRCVVTNGTISVGVNFNKPDVFDKLFVFYSPQIPPRDFFQAIYRVRHPKDKTMCLYRDRWCDLDYSLENVQFPDCEVFKQLRKDLRIEELANNNYQTWETFHLFCELANVTIIPEDLDVLTKENNKYLDELIDNANCRFDWDKIPTIPSDIPDDVLEEWQAKIYSNRATLDDRLMYQKFLFMSRFAPNAEEKTMSLVWDGNMHLPRQLMTLRQSPDHLINNLLQENSVILNDEFTAFPDQMLTSIPFDKIKAQFFFSKAPTDYRTNLCARMLGAFFQRRIYSPKKRSVETEDTEETSTNDAVSRKRKQTDGKRSYWYETDKEWSDMALIKLSCYSLNFMTDNVEIQRNDFLKMEKDMRNMISKWYKHLNEVECKLTTSNLPFDVLDIGIIMHDTYEGNRTIAQKKSALENLKAFVQSSRYKYKYSLIKQIECIVNMFEKYEEMRLTDLPFKVGEPEMSDSFKTAYDEDKRLGVESAKKSNERRSMRMMK
ncbi:hypothetical protein HKX48_000630 [Thoreauomyces humboldtii]|nr:hypothetical protein HKX48_000630 [Thoreauomyces humboldtii]